MRAGPTPDEERLAELETRDAEVRRQLAYILVLLRDSKYARVEAIVEKLLEEEE